MTQEVLLEQKPSLAICSHKECTGRNIKGSENWSDRARPGRWAHTAARGTAWPTTRTLAQHTATPLLSSLSSLLRTSPKGWAADLRRPSPAPTGPSEKGKGTRAHLVSGLLSGRLLLSKRGFLQKEENALRKEELARDPKNNKHLPLSPQTPTSKIIHRTTQILIHTLIFCLKSQSFRILRIPAPQCEVLLQTLYCEHCCLNGPWPLLLSPTTAYSPQVPWSSPLPNPSKPHTFSNARIHLPYSFSHSTIFLLKKKKKF